MVILAAGPHYIQRCLLYTQRKYLEIRYALEVFLNKIHNQLLKLDFNLGLLYNMALHYTTLHVRAPCNVNKHVSNKLLQINCHRVKCTLHVLGLRSLRQSFPAV